MSAVEETAKAVEVEVPAKAEDTAQVEESAKPQDTLNSEDTIAEEEPTTVEDTKTEDKKVEDATTKETDEAKKPKILKTTTKIDENRRATYSKYNPDVLPESDDPKEIRKQVEFYFSDGNLPHDKHMWEITGGSENKPVPIKDIATFKRMRRFQPYSAVVAALKDSTFLKVSGEEGEEVMERQKPYISNANQERINARSAYVKGFGDEDEDTQFKIEAFFGELGPYNAVRLRRTDPEKLFKGSVFVEFPDEEGLEKFLALDPKPKWKDHELMIMSKKAYMTEKLGLIRDGQMEPGNRKKFFEGKEGASRGRGRGRDNRDRNGGKYDKDDWKKRRDNDQKNGFGDRHRGGRDGRGRGRGGRGRDNRDNRDDRDDSRRGPRHAVKPSIQSTDSKGKPIDNEKNGDVKDKQEVSGATNGKRARENDGDGAEPQAKKVDTKVAVPAEAS